MDADLLRRLTEAGTTRVREVLEQAFPVLPKEGTGTTRPRSAPQLVLPEDGAGTTRKVGTTDTGTTGEGSTASGTTGPVLPVVVKPVPPWRAKLEEQRDKLAKAKAEKDAARSAAERAGKLV